MVRDTQDSKKKMLEALEYNLGIVSTSCASADVSRATHYRWLQEDPEYKAYVQDIHEAAIDFVEGQLYAKIKDKDTASIIFYLKSKAKHRGYIERQQVEVTDTKEFTVKVIE
jgi:hypothetical protein|tara:strand:+ start:1660 stop:1995 length:336 start_codon:yes stop_codon:yes gene_type:complete